jgi:hypothetical protein
MVSTQPKKPWGGSRKGAGRKKGPMVSHAARIDFSRRRTPVLIECPLRPNVPSLQNSALRKAFRRASGRARRFGLRITQFSLRPHAIEFVAEFQSKDHLERSLKSLNTTMALAVKKEVHKKSELRHRGRVFIDRFRLTVLSTTQMVHAAFGKLFSNHSSITLVRFSSAFACLWIRNASPVFKIPSFKSQTPPSDLDEILSSPRFKALAAVHGLA